MAGPIEKIKIDVNDLAEQIAARLSINTEYPRWMKLRDAAKYSAIGRQRLKDLAQDGSIIGFQDPESNRRDWIFDRTSIDAYREAQAGQDVVAAAAVSLRSRLGRR